MACAGKLGLFHQPSLLRKNFVVLRERAAEVRARKFEFSRPRELACMLAPGAETGRRKDDAGALREPEPQPKSLSVFGAGWFTAPVGLLSLSYLLLRKQGRIGQRRGLARPAHAILHT
jgi:hypothetical protein